MTDEKDKSPWANRDNVSTQAEAVEALADFFSSTAGISTALGKKTRRGGPKKSDLDAAESLANKWDIPFSRELTVQMIKQMDEKRWASDDDGYLVGHIWVSSSEGC